MSSKYSIRPHPQSKVPPAPYQRDIVKRDLCGDVRTLPLPISQIAYSGPAPVNYETFDIGGQGTIQNPSQAQSFIIDFGQTNDVSVAESGAKPLFNFYLEYASGVNHLLSLRPIGSDSIRTPLFVTIFPYDIDNPKDNSKITFYFSSTYRGETGLGVLNTTADPISYSVKDETPNLANNYWSWSTDNFQTSSSLVQFKLITGISLKFTKLTSQFSISHYIHVQTDSTPISSPIYFARIIHLTACFLDPANCKPSATALASIQRNILKN